MPTNTYGGISAEAKTFYDRTLLERLLPELVHAQWGQKKRIPKNEGDTVDFRKFASLTAATTPLTEGVTPSGSSLSVTNVTATVGLYGDYVEISDKLDMMGIDPVLTETAELLGEQAGNTIDQVVRNVVAAGTGVQRVNSRAARTDIVSMDLISIMEIRKAKRTLSNYNVKKLPGGYYIGIVHPYTVYDLQNDTMWQDVSIYSNKEAVFNGEVGKLFGVKFIETTNAKVFTAGGSGSIDVYGTLILGANYYGIPDIAGSSKPETIFKNFGSAGTADPLNQRATKGWKAYFTAIRLDELCCVRIEHAVSS